MTKLPSILYACYFKEKIEKEQSVEEHALTFIQSGTVQFVTPDGIESCHAGDIILVRRNQLAKARKIPDIHGRPVKSVTLFLTQAILRSYAAVHNIEQRPMYSGPKIWRLNPNAFLEAYFQSLLPYYEHPEALDEPMIKLKSNEAIELLIRLGNRARDFLYDFSEPHKIDLEAFMLRNFEYNIPLRELPG